MGVHLLTAHAVEVGAQDVKDNVHRGASAPDERVGVLHRRDGRHHRGDLRQREIRRSAALQQRAAQQVGPAAQRLGLAEAEVAAALVDVDRLRGLAQRE